jgi:hypothetical protein
MLLDVVGGIRVLSRFRRVARWRSLSGWGAGGKRIEEAFGVTLADTADGAVLRKPHKHAVRATLA